MSSIILTENTYHIIPLEFQSGFEDLMWETYRYRCLGNNLPSYDFFWEDDDLDEFLQEITSFHEFGDYRHYLQLTTEGEIEDFLALKGGNIHYYSRDICLYLERHKFCHFDKDNKLKFSPLCEVW